MHLTTFKETFFRRRKLNNGEQLINLNSILIMKKSKIRPRKHKVKHKVRVTFFKKSQKLQRILKF